LISHGNFYSISSAQQVQDARLQRDAPTIKTAMKAYEEAEEKYIPVLMAQVLICGSLIRFLIQFLHSRLKSIGISEIILKWNESSVSQWNSALSIVSGS